MLRLLGLLAVFSACDPDEKDTGKTSDTEVDSDTDADSDTDTDVAATRDMFVVFGYPAVQEQLSLEVSLGIMGATETSDGVYEISYGPTRWNITIENSPDNFTLGVLSENAVLVYSGHSNYGLGIHFSDGVDHTINTEVDNIYDDFYNMGSEYAGLNLEYLRDIQAYPNLQVDSSVIAENPTNYLNGLGIERFPNDEGIEAGSIFQLKYDDSNAPYHYTKDEEKFLIVEAGDGDLPSSRRNTVTFIKSCFSGQYFYESFDRGVLFYTNGNVATENPVSTIDIFVKGMILQKSYSDIVEDMNEKENIYDYIEID